MSKPQTLDEILSDLEFALGVDDRHNDVKKDDAKAVLSAMIDEIVGEDEPYAEEAGIDQRYKGAWNDNTWNMNGLRNEQRQRAKQLGFILNKEDK